MNQIPMKCLVFNTPSHAISTLNRISEILTRDKQFQNISCFQITEMPKLVYHHRHHSGEQLRKHISENDTHQVTIYVLPRYLQEVKEGLSKHGRRMLNLHKDEKRTFVYDEFDSRLNFLTIL